MMTFVIVIALVLGAILLFGRSKEDTTNSGEVSEEVQELLDTGAPDWAISEQMMREDLQQSIEDIKAQK